VLGLTQATGLLALHALASEAIAAGPDVRAWAVSPPRLIFAMVVSLADSPLKSSRWRRWRPSSRW
jgi:hypothetical protein